MHEMPIKPPKNLSVPGTSKYIAERGEGTEKGERLRGNKGERVVVARPHYLFPPYLLLSLSLSISLSRLSETGTVQSYERRRLQ